MFAVGELDMFSLRCEPQKAHSSLRGTPAAQTRYMLTPFAFDMLRSAQRESIAPPPNVSSLALPSATHIERVSAISSRRLYRATRRRRISTLSSAEPISFRKAYSPCPRRSTPCNPSRRCANIFCHRTCLQGRLVKDWSI